MSTASELARVVSGDVRRVEIYITDEECVRLPKDELAMKQAEINGAIEIAHRLGLTVTRHRDQLQYTEVIAFFREASL
jgi:hypothetical protein